MSGIQKKTFLALCGQHSSPEPSRVPPKQTRKQNQRMLALALVLATAMAAAAATAGSTAPGCQRRSRPSSPCKTGPSTEWCGRTVHRAAWRRLPRQRLLSVMSGHASVPRVGDAAARAGAQRAPHHGGSKRMLSVGRVRRPLSTLSSQAAAPLGGCAGLALRQARSAGLPVERARLRRQERGRRSFLVL